MSDPIEKTPFQSKKFIAWLISLAVMGGIMVYALYSQTFVMAMALFMSVGMMAIGAISIGYVLSQSALDKFCRGISGLKVGPGGSGGCNEGNTHESLE
jgi:hypothetical protein